MMKILIIQVGQLGDLLLTLPVLNALKRARGSVQIHVLVQDEYVSFLKKAKSADYVYSAQGISKQLEKLGQIDFSEIINLSSTAASADLTYLLGDKKGVLTFGYSRHDDGTLKISDDASGYIFAQCGPKKAGRLHVIDLFSSLASVDLTADDLAFESIFGLSFENQTVQISNPKIVVQVGNLSTGKSHGLRTWKMALLKLAAHYNGEVAFIGGPEHRADSAYLMSHIKSRRFRNLTGQLNIEQSISLARNAEYLISCGDVLSEIATIVQRPCLELSGETTNFWETGPLSKGSQVLTKLNPDVTDEHVATAIVLFAKTGIASEKAYAVSDNSNQPDFVRFTGSGSTGDTEWSILKALYLPSDFPTINDAVFLSAVEKLKDANLVAAEQVEKLNAVNSKNLSQVIELYDDIARTIQTMCPIVRPLNDWFFAERSQLQPTSFEITKAQTSELHRKFVMVCEVLIDLASPTRSIDRGSSQDNDVQL